MRSRITTRGRTTIPPEVREALGLEAGDEIAWVHDGDAVYVSKAGGRGLRVEKWIGHARALAGVDVDELIDEMRGRGPFT